VPLNLWFVFSFPHKINTDGWQNIFVVQILTDEEVLLPISATRHSPQFDGEKETEISSASRQIEFNACSVLEG
jgi:hypothetical protein